MGRRSKKAGRSGTPAANVETVRRRPVSRHEQQLIDAKVANERLMVAVDCLRRDLDMMVRLADTVFAELDQLNQRDKDLARCWQAQGNHAGAHAVLPQTGATRLDLPQRIARARSLACEGLRKAEQELMRQTPPQWQNVAAPREPEKAVMRDGKTGEIRELWF